MQSCLLPFVHTMRELLGCLIIDLGISKVTILKNSSKRFNLWGVLDLGKNEG